jgi:hypothetical protein
MANKQQCENA